MFDFLFWGVALTTKAPALSKPSAARRESESDFAPIAFS
jgi:hypothetical protein